MKLSKTTNLANTKILIDKGMLLHVSLSLSGNSSAAERKTIDHHPPSHHHPICADAWHLEIAHQPSQKFHETSLPNGGPEINDGIHGNGNISLNSALV